VRESARSRWQASHCACAAGVVCHRGFSTASTNRPDGEDNGRQVAPVGILRADQSLTKRRLCRKLKNPGSPSLVTRGPGKSVGSQLRADYSPKNIFQDTCNWPPVIRVGYCTSASIVFPACESRWGETDDASDVRAVPNSVRYIVAGIRLRFRFRGTLQINKESRPARLKVAYKV
jgi:hypothetical protein